ncbi:CGH_3_collapsed_G0023280.mRNA.1.CDS.1 [Saccharomyces cerevisiae]|nr:CGH_3_collapsed_G0023280.mRNA.1.CDS.1 [Saccharomyces cerevisiae]
MILSGRVKVPPAADPLLRILESRAFNFTRHDHDDNASGDDFYDDGQYSDNTSHYYDDIPDSFDSTDESSTRPKHKIIKEEECRWGHAVVMMMIMMMMVTDVVAGMEILIAKMKIMITEDLQIETAAAIEAHR